MFYSTVKHVFEKQIFHSSIRRHALLLNYCLPVVTFTYMLNSCNNHYHRPPIDIRQSRQQSIKRRDMIDEKVVKKLQE